MKIVNKKIDELIPYINNPRQNDNAVDAVASSIKNYGFKVPIRDINGDFEDWCEDNDAKYSAKMLADTLLSKFGIDKKVIKINGTATRCYYIVDKRN